MSSSAQSQARPAKISENSVPVVVLVSSQHGGIGIIRSLGSQGIPIYGIHRDPWEPAALSRYLQGIFTWDFSSAAATESVSFLLDIAQKIGQRSVLIPTSDITALFVAENAEALAQRYLVSSSSAEIVRRFCSKKLTSHLCRKIGIPTAETLTPECRGDVLDFGRQTRFPVIVKGEYGDFRRVKGYARVAIVRSKQELLDIFDLNAEAGGRNLVIQEYIPGADDSIWMFNGYFNQRSECVFGATGRKLRQFPPHRGSTSLGICMRNQVVEQQTLQLTSAVGYRGPLDIGFRFDSRDGQYKLLDVNPRIGATFRLFVGVNGLDVVRTLYLDLTGQKIPSCEVPEGRKWIVESNDLITSLTYLWQGELSIACWLESLRGIRERVWTNLDDPVPLAGLPLLWLSKGFGDGRPMVVQKFAKTSVG